MDTQARNFVFMVSGVLLLAGAITYITQWIYAPYVFAVGSAGLTVSFMSVPYKHLDFRHRRLHRINVMAGVSTIVASVFMFRSRMEWVAFLLITALLLLYTSFAVKSKQ
jgi:hypothetical protein